MISKSLKVCALNLPTDGSADDQIHCFKEGATCEAGAEKLKTQLAIVVSEELDDTNPFSLINQEDMETASQPFHLLDDDEESDEELDIVAVAQWLRASNIFHNCVRQHLNGAGWSPAGSVGRDLNLQKLNYQYLTTSVAVLLVVR